MDRLLPDKPHKKGGKSHFIASTKGRLIATTKPQANSERIAWLTEKGREFLHEQELD